MLHEQLYYPNIRPKISSKLAISLLHWNNLQIIYPIEKTAYLPHSRGVMGELEAEGILSRKSVYYEDADSASNYFIQLASIAQDRQNPRHSIVRTLLRPLPAGSKSGQYCIYEGKANHDLANSMPKYFQSGADKYGNTVFYCTRQTGLTYMTILASILNKRAQYSNTITDDRDAYPLYVRLNSLLDFSSSPDPAEFVPTVRATAEIERIFLIPLLNVLEPKNFSGDKTLEKILEFRRDPNNEEARKAYLRRIDSLLADLKGCTSNEEAEDIIRKHEEKFQRDLTIMIEACRSKGIPVNKRILAHGGMNAWELAGRVWDTTCTVKNIISLNFLALVKPLLSLKPSVDFYNTNLRRNESYYPLLIQETFNPTYAQRLFQRVKTLGHLEIPATTM